MTSLYYADDPYIDTDTVFGVSQSLIVEPLPGLPDSPFPGLRSIRYDFVLAKSIPGDEDSRVGADPSSSASEDSRPWTAN